MPRVMNGRPNRILGVAIASYVVILAHASLAAGTMQDAADAFARGDNRAAYDIVRPLADSGDAQAQFSLGMMFAQGLGVAKDEAEAVLWFTRAAEQGEPNAQVNLGSAYLKGKGTAVDFEKAAFWFRRAAEQGFAAGQFNLGLCYAKGRGVAQNDGIAVEWYRKAAIQGSVQAQVNLGVAHESGLGVPRDLVLAYVWFAVAALGNAGEASAIAQENRELVAVKLSPNELADAKRSVVRCTDSGLRYCP